MAKYEANGEKKKGPGWLGLELDRDATVFSPSPHPSHPPRSPSVRHQRWRECVCLCGYKYIYTEN
jgi:hypothetical protein